MNPTTNPCSCSDHQSDLALRRITLYYTLAAVLVCVLIALFFFRMIKAA